jgi:DNA helicase-2/ATP-dependent DNA helicase PcrA
MKSVLIGAHMSLLLDKTQQEIVSAPADARFLVQAGPGTGKTEVVARRLAYLLSKGGLKPHQILVLSFSRSAVKALVQRTRSLKTLDPIIVERLRYLSIRTFDSWSFRMLRLLGHVPDELLRNEYDDNICLLLEELRELGTGGTVEAEELRLHNVRHVIVDEYQDLAGARASLVQALLEGVAPSNDEGCGFTILGDPNQAIYDYTLRGNDDTDHLTSRDLALWIEAEYGAELDISLLESNHRASPEIADLIGRAESTLRACEERQEDPLPKLLELVHESGGKVTVEDILPRLSQPGDRGRLAILCRGNSQIRELIAKVRQLTWQTDTDTSQLHLGIKTSPRLLPSWIARMLCRYEGSQLTKKQFTKIFSLSFHELDETTPGKGDPDAAWMTLLNFARLGEDERAIGMDQLRQRVAWPDSLPDDEGESEAQIIVTTIHQAKGLEYDSVYVMHNGNGLDEADVYEEGRVLFVGASRAREDLALLQLDEERPFYPKDLAGGKRRRWYRRFSKGFTQMDLGSEGDVDQESIIRTDVQGNEDAVASVQAFLSDNEPELIGMPVVLRRAKLPGQKLRFVYNIYLEIPDSEDICLGRMQEFVTLDLLGVMHKKQSLPKNIYNLRIVGVTTCVTNAQTHEKVPGPWCKSRIWLSVNIHGLAQFKPGWKKY